MSKFKIYAGLSGGFGGARFCGVYDCEDKNEAVSIAREEAVSEYGSYGGYHGLYTWDSMRQEIADDLYDGDIEQVDPEDVDIAMIEEVEGWLDYYVEETVGDKFDEDGNELEN